MTGILQAVILDPMSLPIDFLYLEGSPKHITLQYNVEREDFDHLIDLPMTVGAWAHCYNSEIQAIKVALPPWCPCSIPVPHITVSWIPGSDPVRSNAMLAGDHISEDVGYPIHTIIQWTEWGQTKPNRTCSVCKVQALRSDNSTGICAKCQRNRLPNSRYR